MLTWLGTNPGLIFLLLLIIGIGVVAYGEIKFAKGEAACTVAQVHQQNEVQKNEIKRLNNRPRGLDDRLSRLQRWRKFVRDGESKSIH